MTNDPDAFLRRLMTDAGIVTGMRVLDIGCGRGDVSALGARQVGPQGEVVGIDRDSDALDIARARAAEIDAAPMRFVRADLSDIPDLGTFDAVVGRRVLMYLPDAVAALGSLAACLRPGGLILFQEHDATGTPLSSVPLPLHEAAHGWMWRTVAREGANISMGFGLAEALTRAGFVLGEVRAEAVVQTPSQAHRTGEIVRAMLPRILRQSVASEAEIDVETLDKRLREEREAAAATFIGELVFGAYARKPG